MDKEYSSLPNTDADGGDNDDLGIASHEEKMPLDASAGRGDSAHGNSVDSDASCGSSADFTGTNDSSEAVNTPELRNADENIANSSDGQNVEVAQDRPQEPARS